MGEIEKIDYVVKPVRAAKKVRPTELARTDLSFCDSPATPVIFDGRSFCLTGIFEFEDGDRNKCEDAIRARGGVCWQNANRDLDYLVIGTFIENAWLHKGYGRKIAAALELKQRNAKCKIVSEANLAMAMQSTPELPFEKRVQIGEQSKGHQIQQLQQEVEQLKKSREEIFQLLKRELDSLTYQRLIGQLEIL